MSEPFDNPPPAYSSYLNQQQMVSDIMGLRALLQDQYRVIAAIEANIQLLNDRVTELEMVITTGEEA
jgi:hypothetical protein